MKFAWIIPVLLLASAARAAGPVIVTEPSVAQYRQAADAARKQLPDPVEIAPSEEDFAARLADATVIVAVGQKSLSEVKAAAPDKPVVFCLVLGATQDLVSKTVTGVPIESDPAGVLEQMKALTPKAKRVGLLFNATTHARWMALAQKAASDLGLELVPAPAENAGAVKSLLEGMAGKIDAVWLAPDPALFDREMFRFVLGFTSERKLPLWGFLDSFTEEGALASVAPDYGDIGDRAGRLAAGINKKAAGARTPVPEPVYAPGRLSINTRTAHALGIDLPDAAVSRARQVYR